MKLRIILILFMCIFIVGCTEESSEDYIARKTGLNLSSCAIEKNEDTHGGFHGDGEMLVILNCSNANEELLNQINSWNSLPLTENLELIMYGGEKDGVSYGYEFATKIGIPKITNGYYHFINRDSEALNENDDDILNKYSFNFTLILYDNDNEKMYYYEIDT